MPPPVDNATKEALFKITGHACPERTAYLVNDHQNDGGQKEAHFVLDENGNPMTAKVNLAAFLSEEEIARLYQKDQNPEDIADLHYCVKKLAVMQSGILARLSSTKQAVEKKQELKHANFIANYELENLTKLKKQEEKDADLIARIKEEEEKEKKSVALSQTNQTKRNEEIKSQLKKAVEKNVDNQHINEIDFANPKNQNQMKQTLSQSASNPWLEKYRKYILMFMGFLNGYMLGCMLGFASTDFLAHIPALFSVLNDGMVTPILIGAFALAAAVSKTWGNKLAEEQHLANLKEKRLDPEYLEKQGKLDQLNKKIKRLKHRLEGYANTIASGIQKIAGEERTQEYHNDIKALIEKSQKKLIRGKTILLGIRGVFKVLVDVSSVIFITRCLVTMGFLKALLPAIFATSSAMTALSTGVFGMFGVVFTAHPVGIAILVIAAVLLVIKAVVELYMIAQQKKEMQKIDQVDLHLEKAESEYKHLSQVKNFLKAEAEQLQVTLNINEEEYETERESLVEGIGEESSRKLHLPPVLKNIRNSGNGKREESSSTGKAHGIELTSVLR